MKNELKKQIKIILKDLYNPNTSMGRIITFYKNNHIIGHLSLTWPSKLWFSYHNNTKFVDIYFPNYFNDYIFEDNSLFIYIYIKENILYLQQNNLIKKFDLDCIFEFDKYELMKDFENSTIESIEDNQYKIKYIDIMQSKQAKIKTDIIITSYKDYDILPNLLDSIKNTHQNIINKIIIVNNNNDDNSFLINIFKQYDFKYEIISNPDKSYVKNRISGINLALKQVKSEIITILDSDIIFINNNWVKTYDVYNQIEGLTGVANVADQFGTHYFRDTQLVLPRFHSCFFHCKTEYLKTQISKDEDFLGDFKLSLLYNNIKICPIGLHFSKLYADARSNNDIFYIFDNSEIISLNKINSMSSDNFDNIICIHFENMSFREVWKNEKYINFKNNNILSAMNKIYDYTQNDIIKNIIDKYSK